MLPEKSVVLLKNHQGKGDLPFIFFQDSK